MPWCKCTIVGMQWCKCPLVGMPWCKCPHGACHDANVCLVHVMKWMPPCGYAMTWMLWCKHNLFKNSRGFLSAWNQNIFKSWFIIPEMSSSFWLRVPKKLVNTVRNLWMGYWLGIWWSDSKYLFSQSDWAMEWHVFKAFFFFFWKINFLKIKHFKKIHF